jgi:segregation and condensation protein B
MTDQPLKHIIEAALFIAGKPLSIDHLIELFSETEVPDRSAIRSCLKELREDYAQRGIELVQVASGYRFQTKPDLISWLKRLQPERSPRYSRALLETIAIIAYRQPITRAEIEKIRGISVSTDLMKRLQDYNWIRILARKDSPGKPALYGTTREFLNYFNLKALNELPTLAELPNLIELQTPPALESENEQKEDEPEVVTEEPNVDRNVLESEETTVVPEPNDIESENQPASETVEPKKIQLNQAALEALASDTTPIKNTSETEKSVSSKETPKDNAEQMSFKL